MNSYDDLEYNNYYYYASYYEKSREIKEVY